MSAVTIAGGGVAGAAAACLLAAAGRPVRLFERTTQPTHKICGEFLSHEALFYLRRIGIDAEALGGQTISHVRLVGAGAMSTTALPFQGIGLTRRTLDEALLARAAANGAEIRRGEAFRLGDETPVGGGATLFLATGKHDLRGLTRRVTRTPEDLVGLKTFFRLAPAQQAALAGHVEIILLSGGYAGLQLVEGGQANLCLLVQRARLLAADGRWPSLLESLLRESAHLRTRLSGAKDMLAQPLSIYRVPYGFVHDARPDDPEHLFRLGDQFGVIPSFAGDGMSMALHSAAVAVDCHLAGETAGTFHRRLRRDIAAPIARASALYHVGRRSGGQALLVTLAAHLPSAVRLATRLTRVPAGALVAG